MRPIEARLAEAEARRQRALQRKASAERDLARLGGKSRREETRRKCIVGYAVQRVLANPQLSLAMRNRVRELLELHLIDRDRAVVADLLQREVTP